MRERKFTTIDSELIKRNYPKAYDKLVGWYDIPEISIEERKHLVDQMLFIIPRVLFDFFDDHEVFVVIEYAGEGKYKGFIWNNDKASDYQLNTSRNKIEEVLFNQAFSMIEEEN